jgi:hypothetical protein
MLKFVTRLAPKKNIIFVYAKRFQFAGSTVMRGQQLYELAKSTFPNYKIAYAPSDTRFKNSTLFLSKGVINTASPRQLEQLKKDGNKLIFDIVDGVLPDYTKDFVDTIVAASQSAYLAYKRDYPTIRVIKVDHHVDPRIRKLKPQKINNIKIGYFGEPTNTIISPKISKYVDFVHIDTSKQEDDWLKKLPKYNMHYAVRAKTPAGRHKPFLKGFTAAYCDSNIIIQRSNAEAVYWLGDDYPYLFDDPVNESNIIEHILYAMKSYNSAEWHRGLEAMARLRNNVSDITISEQLRELFSQ